MDHFILVLKAMSIGGHFSDHSHEKQIYHTLTKVYPFNSSHYFFKQVLSNSLTIWSAHQANKVEFYLMSYLLADRLTITCTTQSCAIKVLLSQMSFGDNLESHHIALANTSSWQHMKKHLQMGQLAKVNILCHRGGAEQSWHYSRILTHPVDCFQDQLEFTIV